MGHKFNKKIVRDCAYLLNNWLTELHYFDYADKGENQNETLDKQAEAGPQISAISFLSLVVEPYGLTEFVHGLKIVVKRSHLFSMNFNYNQFFQWNYDLV